MIPAIPGQGESAAALVRSTLVGIGRLHDELPAASNRLSAATRDRLDVVIADARAAADMIGARSAADGSAVAGQVAAVDASLASLEHRADQLPRTLEPLAGALYVAARRNGMWAAASDASLVPYVLQREPLAGRPTLQELATTPAVEPRRFARTAQSTVLLGAGGARSVLAKKPFDGAVWESIASAANRGAGLDEFAARATLRDDGWAFIEMVPGNDLADALTEARTAGHHLEPAAAVEAALAGARELPPGIDGARIARVERQVLGAVDRIRGEQDRSTTNLLLAPQHARVFLVDHSVPPSTRPGAAHELGAQLHGAPDAAGQALLDPLAIDVLEMRVPGLFGSLEQHVAELAARSNATTVKRAQLHETLVGPPTERAEALLATGAFPVQPG